MALTRCTECNHQVSDKAAACPSCGAPFGDRDQREHDATLPAFSRSSHESGASDPRYSGFYGYIRRHWNGDFSLARSYWINNTLVSAGVLWTAASIARAMGIQSAAGLSAAIVIIFALTLVTWIWGLRGTWRSATKHKRAGGRYAGLAKTMVVVSVCLGIGQGGKLGTIVSEHWAVALSGGQFGESTQFHVSPNGQTVLLKGGMNEGAADALTRALELAPGVRLVQLSSAGGWMREGYLVHDVIAKRGLATHVEDECSSACTLAFLGGARRTMHANARLGFHPVHTIGNGEERRHVDLENTRAIYAAAGLSRGFIEQLLRIPGDSMWYPTASELLEGNVLTVQGGWDTARAEVTHQLDATLRSNLQHVQLPTPIHTALLDCMVNEHIAWLNASGCGYSVVDGQAAEVSLRQRNACLARTGYVAKIDEIDMRCSQQHIPNDWSVLTETFSHSFAAALVPQDPTSEAAAQLGACAARRYLQQLARTECLPFRSTEMSSKNLFADSGCLDSQRAALAPFEAKIKAECSAQIKPKAK